MARIVNMTCTFSLNTSLDLKEIAMKGMNVIHCTSPFEVTRMRFRKPYASAMIYSTGKVVVLGCKSKEEVGIVAKKTQQVLG